MSFSCCIFSAQYLPHIGGVEVYVQKLSNNLVKKGLDITIVTSLLPDTKEYEVLNNGIEIYRLPSYQLMNCRLPILKSGSRLKEVEEKLSNKRFDLVVVNTRFYALSLFAVKFAYRNNIKSIVIEHGTNYLTVNNSVFDKVIKSYEHNITNKVKKYCSDFYGVSRACCDWLKIFDISAKGTIYNNIDTAELEKIKTDGKYRQEYKISKNEIMVSFIGRLVEEKGIIQLVNAVNELNKRGERIYLLIAGDGPLYEKIKESRYVKLLGKLCFPDVMSLLECSDIFCLPSRSEGFPTVVLEAAYKNCFIITTDKGGAKELIISEEYGEIICDNSCEEIEKAILCATKNDGYRKVASGMANKRVLENFTTDKVSERFIEEFVPTEEIR